MRLTARLPLRVAAAVVVAVRLLLPLAEAAPASQPSLQIMQHHVPVAVSANHALSIGALPSNRRLNFIIHLPVRNQAALSDLLSRQSDPSSPDYRHWLSVSEFTEQFGRTSDEYRKVLDFAQANGFKVIYQSPNRLMVAASGTAGQVESAFHVKMQQYPHPGEARSFYAPDREPSMSLDVPVSHISGLNDFARPHPLGERRPGAWVAIEPGPGRATSPLVGSNAAAMHPLAAGISAASGGSGPSTSFLGSDIRTAYNMGSNTGTGQSVGLMEFTGYAKSDIDLYFSSTGKTNKVPLVNVVVDGGTATDFDNINNEAEVCLDVEQVASVAPGLSQIILYIGPESFGTGVDGFILNRMATDNVAKQLSNSWWWAPDDPQTDDPYFEEMAAQGQTFFNASGDNGAYGNGDSFDSSYPAEDVHVTTVGGTTLTTNGIGGTWQSEVVWNAGSRGSGGGPANDSTDFPIQSWQSPVINSANGGSTTLRNIPDVALHSDFNNYICYANGLCETDWGGTSFASPRWAAWLALVNQNVVSQGHAAGLGFLNPILYSLGRGAGYLSSFHDVTVGNNSVNGQTTFFEAVSGYDLATGWGSMNGANLMAALAQTTTSSFSLTDTPGSLTLNRSGKATAAITVSPVGGFKDSVKLSASGLPSGVTASFSSNPTKTTSTLTLTASSTATLGAATITISGSSDGLTETTKLAVTVKAAPAPGFSLATSPGNLTISQGGTGTETVTLKPANGFSGKVTLSASGLPSGVTAAFATNPTSGSSILTLKVNSATKPGTYTISIKGTSGSLTATTKVTLTVRARVAQGFNLRVVLSVRAG
jgi:subtilase family serine protease